MTRTEFTADGCAKEVEANVTDPNGVLFVVKPPDLRKEPPREDLKGAKNPGEADEEAREGDEGGKGRQDKAAKGAKERTPTDQVVAKILRDRGDELSGAAKGWWSAFKQYFEGRNHVDQLPKLPCTLECTNDETGEQFQHQLHGTPCDLKPILRALMRFERPLITWDLFEDPPPAEFSAATRAEAPPPPVAAAPAAAASAPARQPLRDPRDVNTVIHEGQSLAEADANIAAVDLQHWVETAPDRLEAGEVKAGELYMIKLEQDNFPHEFKVGLGRCKSKPAQVDS